MVYELLQTEMDGDAPEENPYTPFGVLADYKKTPVKSEGENAIQKFSRISGRSDITYILERI